MAAATKNKRGRPVKEEYKEAYWLANIGDEDYAGRSRRTIRTIEAAWPFTGIIIRNDDAFYMYHFFYTKEGRPIKTGIAEQLGRMISENLITEEQALNMAENIIADYESGTTAKTIERHLRQLRKALQTKKTDKGAGYDK